MTELAQWPVDELIPHRPPMQLLSQVLAASEERIWSLIRLDNASPFTTTAGIPSIVAMEYLAQTAAAFFSVQARGVDAAQLAAMSPPRPGMLIGCSTLTCACPFFACPGTLLAEVTVASSLPKDSDTGGLVRFDGKLVGQHSEDTSARAPTGVDTLSALFKKAKVLASGSLSVYLPPAVSES